MPGDWKLEAAHAELKRLLAVLFVYIGIADDTRDAMRSLGVMPLLATLDRASWQAGEVDATARAMRALADPASISRRLHRMIHQLLWPLEAAVRRLIIALAANLPRVGSRGQFTLLPQKGAGPQDLALAAKSKLSPTPDAPALPTRPPLFSLLDPQKHVDWKRFDPDAPKLDPSVFDVDPARDHEQVPDSFLMRRIAALAFALNDLPAQAKRFARWTARLGDGRMRRTSPLRCGRPPGSPPMRMPDSRTRSEHHVLAETHSMALRALRRIDTS